MRGREQASDGPERHLLDHVPAQALAVLRLDVGPEPAALAVKKVAQRLEDRRHKVARALWLALDAGRAVLGRDGPDEPERLCAPAGEDRDEAARERADERADVVDRDGIRVCERTRAGARGAEGRRSVRGRAEEGDRATEGARNRPLGSPSLASASTSPPLPTLPWMRSVHVDHARSWNAPISRTRSVATRRLRSSSDVCAGSALDASLVTAWRHVTATRLSVGLSASSGGQVGCETDLWRRDGRHQRRHEPSVPADDLQERRRESGGGQSEAECQRARTRRDEPAVRASRSGRPARG